MSTRRTIGIVSAVGLLSTTLYFMQNCAPAAKMAFMTQDSANAAAGDASEFVQIERLGRPAVNEGLVLDNKKLVAFNSISPFQDLDFGNAAVAAVLTEASAALNLFDSLEGKNNFNDDPTKNEVVAGFLPDVLRIDTSKDIPVGTASYNGDFVLVAGTQAPMLTGGRKLEDDVVDITLSYLVAGDPTGATIKDNVTYKGTAGNPSQGHRMLHGQSQYNGPAKFPFLATPY